MKPWQGLAHAILVVAAVIYGRYLIFDLITSLMGHRPSHSLLMGSVALSCVVGCLPIVALHFPNSLVRGSVRVLRLVPQHSVKGMVHSYEECANMERIVWTSAIHLAAC